MSKQPKDFKSTAAGREKARQSRKAFEKACRENPDTGPCRSMYPETNGTPPPVPVEKG